jgi:hypothetical protein
MTAINQLIFNSITEVPEYLESRPSLHSGSARDTRASKRWDDGLGFDGAMDMARDGGWWEEGAAKMIDATSEAIQLKREGAAPEIEYDVTGARLDMDEYLSGEPECWERIDDEQVSQVINIGVQLYTPGGNDMQMFVNRGAALLSIIDDLEAQGVRVELWGCVSGINRKGRREAIDMRIKLKGADESWSPASIAFGLCHPAVSRRLGFAAVETFENLRRYAHGHTLDYDNDRPIDSDFQIWFGYRDMVRCDSNYDNVERALKRVTAEVKRQLTDGNYMQIEEEA